MAKGIEIGIASETKAFKLGVEAGIIAPLEDAVDKLTEMGKSKGPEQLERGMKEAQDATQKLQRETKETADQIERKFRESYRGVARSADENLGRVGQATANLKQEALQNFSETASSFDGSLSSIADGIQGTLGGASIAVGGAAGVALGALAVAGGAVGQALTNAIEEDAAAAEERIQAMYDSFIESGLDYLTKEQALEALSAITGDPEKVAQAKEQAKELGLSIETIIAAQVQKGEERNAVQARLNELLAEANQKLEDGTYTDGRRLTTLEAIRDQYAKLNGEQETAIQGADLYRVASELITGQQRLTNEEIQIQNRLLAETPKTLPVRLEVDSSAIDQAIRQSRTLQVEVQLTRNGSPVY